MQTHTYNIAVYKITCINQYQLAYVEVVCPLLKFSIIDHSIFVVQMSISYHHYTPKPWLRTDDDWRTILMAGLRQLMAASHGLQHHKQHKTAVFEFSKLI